MPPISNPPPTWRRIAAASAIFLFLLFPTPLPSAAAQPASASPNDESSSSTPANGTLTPFVLVILVVIIIFFFLLTTFSTYVIHFSRTLEGSIGPAVRSPSCLAAPHCLDPAVIETFPTVVYSAVKGHKIGEASLECAVCLNDFEDDDSIRLIPKCDHAFHPNCIGAWLASHTTCPVCRADLLSQRSPQAKSGTEPPQVGVTPLDGGVPERSPREEGQERIQPLDPWDKNETPGLGRIRRFPRSHSTGHSLVRPGEDMERFTLRLPADVRKQLMDRQPREVLQEARPVGSALSERWAFSRMPSFSVHMSSALSPRVAADGCGGFSSGSMHQSRPGL